MSRMHHSVPRDGAPGGSAGRRLRTACGLLPLLIGLMAPPAQATKYAAEFLRLGVGARALGMGGGFVSLADDASAVYWNPAGLAGCTRAEMMFMHAEQFGQIANHDFIGFVQPIAASDRPAAVGVGLIRYAIDDIPVTPLDAYTDLNLNGRYDPGEPIKTEEFYLDSDTEYGLLLSYGRQFSDQLALGGSAKLIRQGLIDNTSFGFGLDLGALYRPIPAWTVGLRIADATNTRISWDTGTKETLDRTVTLGLGYTRALAHLRGRLNGAFALVSSFESATEASQLSGGSWGGDVRGGFEYWHADAVAARVGVDAGALTAGAGLRYHSLGVDYAYLSHEDLDATHRVSASVRF